MDQALFFVYVYIYTYLFIYIGFSSHVNFLVNFQYIFEAVRKPRTYMHICLYYVYHFAPYVFTEYETCIQH